MTTKAKQKPAFNRPSFIAGIIAAVCVFVGVGLEPQQGFHLEKAALFAVAIGLMAWGLSRTIGNMMALGLSCFFGSILLYELFGVPKDGAGPALAALYGGLLIGGLVLIILGSRKSSTKK